VSELNGKPPPDVNLLTPNDYRRLRVKLDGRDPRELLGGEVEDIIQTLTLAYKLREDPGFTWDQAGDISPGEMFDMAGQSPPETPTPAASGSTPGPPAGSSSRRKRAGSEAAPSSAASTASPATSTTP
jgi:hypothetical protein